jgi:hypothetical protein
MRISVNWEQLQSLLDQETKKVCGKVSKSVPIAASDPLPPTPEELLKMAEGLGDPWRFEEESPEPFQGHDVIWVR